MKSGIYIIACLVNGKYYIGRSVNWKKRISWHKKALEKNKHTNVHLQSSFNKYKLKNFTFELLEEWQPEFLCSMENWWCNMLNTHNREFGYNIEPTSPFGKITSSKETKLRLSISHMGQKAWNKGILSKEETKQKLSKAHMGKKLSEETKEKIKNSNMGKKRNEKQKNNISLSLIGRKVSEETKKKIKISNTGKKLSKEHIEKISISNKGKKHSQKAIEKMRSSSKKQKIVQLTLNNEFIKIWDSIKEACDNLKMPSSSICAIWSGRNKTAKGFKWIKLEEWKNNQ
jgi:group I intron endonuclease